MGEVTEKAHRVNNTESLDRGVRVGLGAYGLVHLIVAALALQLAWGERSGAASQQGAFAELARHTAGQLLLYVVAAGLAVLVVWQVAEALVGHRDEDGAKRSLKRVVSLVKAGVYGALAVSAAGMALGSGGSGGRSSERTTDNLTAQLMSAPGGQLLVGAVGLTVLCIGGYLVYHGWDEKFTKGLDVEATAKRRRGPIVAVGKAGYAAKGFALALVGGLFLTAAAQHAPKESGGLDVALHELLRQPFGPVLVSAVALGFACFGLYCFAWARHLDR
jgi:uncharacterized membrane protein